MKLTADQARSNQHKNNAGGGSAAAVKVGAATAQRLDLDRYPTRPMLDTCPETNVSGLPAGEAKRTHVQPDI